MAAAARHLAGRHPRRPDRPHPAAHHRGRVGRHARDPSYLYSGSLLEAATGTAARIGTDPTRHPPLSPAERDFLHASGRAHRRRTRRRQGSSRS